MAIQSTIRAFQGVLSNNDLPKGSSHFPTDFALKRFHKKFERPENVNEQQLSEACFRKWLDVDGELPTSIHLPSGEWYRARLLIHEWLRGRDLRLGGDFPKGSSFFPNKGQCSIEYWLSSGRWSCTPEAFDMFASEVYNHKALKRAFRRRYTRWYRKGKFDMTEREANAFLYKKLSHPYQIFKWKLERIVTFVRGSRFSTVPKNNTARRPINIEPFGNILAQSSLGNAIRDVLKKSCGVDLDTLQDEHKDKISNMDNATIDLSSASDSVSIALVNFLFPERFVSLVHQARSHMTLGLDGVYYVPKKISSMGNGFTFELMTLILTAICRVLDSDATVYGDDIIINRNHSTRLIELLTEVGFSVNTDKSFTDGPFRESCGGNYHRDFGYIKSYDFKWPTSIADCILFYNKCHSLAELYPEFRKLRDDLKRCIPNALRGNSVEYTVSQSHWKEQVEDFHLFFACEPKDSKRVIWPDLVKLCLSPEVKLFKSFRWKPKLRTQPRDKRYLIPNFHWGKIEFYLSSGRVSDDTLTGEGAWVIEELAYCDGRIFRAKDLIDSMKLSTRQ